MFKKIIQFTIILFVLNGCGYTPMYSTNFKNDFNIELIDFKGDNDLNNFIKQKIDGLINTETKNSKTFQVSLSTNYSKDIQIKDKSGKATQYSLNANGHINAHITLSFIPQFSFIILGCFLIPSILKSKSNKKVRPTPMKK